MGLFNIAIKGVAWTSISTIIRSLVSLLQVSILTRFIEKSDFGIVAIATLYIGFIQIFMDMGLSVGIMHKQKISVKEYSSLFWFNIISGLILSVVLIFISPVIAKFYNEPKLLDILLILSLNVLFSSLGNQHRVVLQKNFKFKYLSIIEIFSSITTIILAIYLVYNGYGIYSLVYSTTYNVLSTNILFLICGLYLDRNIKLHFNIKEIGPFVKIGFFSVGSQVLDYLSREIDILIISFFLGKEILGIYSLCKKLIVALYTAINTITLKVITPLFAAIQDNIEKLRNIYYSIIETFAVINLPVYFVISIFSYGILNFLYGESYTETSSILSIISIYYGYMSCSSPVGSLQTALGKTDSGFYWTIFRIILNTVALVIGAQYGLMGITISLFVFLFLSIPIFWKITIKPLIGGKLTDYFYKTFRSFVYLVILSIPFALICNNMTSIIAMISVSILYFICYFILIEIFFKNTYIVGIINNTIFKRINRN